MNHAYVCFAFHPCEANRTCMSPTSHFYSMGHTYGSITVHSYEVTEAYTLPTFYSCRMNRMHTFPIFMPHDVNQTYMFPTRGVVEHDFSMVRPIWRWGIQA